jgi:multidrug resistance efflux pump
LKTELIDIEGRRELAAVERSLSVAEAKIASQAADIARLEKDAEQFRGGGERERQGREAAETERYVSIAHHQRPRAQHMDSYIYILWFKDEKN